MSDPMKVCFINRERSFVVMGDDTVIPITNFIDFDGEDCDPDDAYALVAGDEDFGWLTIEAPDFDTAVH
jgi:hypothetical protein